MVFLSIEYEVSDFQSYLSYFSKRHLVLLMFEYEFCMSMNLGHITIIATENLKK